ncbi:MAG: UDP-N-acetylglucosamine--LPS N-acetylglucosamine transferase [Spirochaetaceae bacterium]|nr:UDP-N-acetylglucosamine--LPS N-acetylglucosamine transferase [Spirochaetaceae bacterium]
MKSSFIYVDAGMGHYVPAKALYDRFIEKGYEATLDNFFLDILDSKKWNSIVKESWKKQLKHPKLERIENTILDNSYNFYLIRFLAKHKKLAQSNFKRWIEKEKPDFLFCTNYLVAPIVTTMLNMNNINIPLFVLGTDIFDNQKIGVSNLIDVQYMPSELGVKNYIRHGFDPSIVKVSPFPLKKGMEFYYNYTKEEARLELALNLNKPTITLNLGGEGIGNTKFIKALAKMDIDWQVIILGGMSEKTKLDVEKFRLRYPSFSLITPGFVDNIGLYIKACDAQVGKTGGNSFLESLYLKRPFFITEILYISKAYIEFMKEYKVGWANNNTKKQIDILKQYFKNKDQQDEMSNVLNNLPINFRINDFVDLIISDYKRFNTTEKLLEKRKIIKQNIKKNHHLKNR